MTNDDDSRTEGNRITISTVCCYIHICETRLVWMGWFDDANILTDNVQVFVLLTMKTATDGRTKGNRNQDGPPNKWVGSIRIYHS
mmetsp:Transcript_7972/g.9299  ORF Transcript_7972/g.9299 Transcript_7972/m.9299 type:complete len:85 (-) Transcript_7972:257-511(-)